VLLAEHLRTGRRGSGGNPPAHTRELQRWPGASL